MNRIYLKDYIIRNNKLNFCDVDLFEFGQADESISICRAKIDCHKCLEEFVLQCFLVFMSEDLFMKSEELGINIGKLENLEEFLFKNDWEEEYQLIPVVSDKMKSLLLKWIDQKTIVKMNLNTLNIDSAIILDKFDSMEQYVVFSTGDYKYLLVRSLG